MIAAMDRSVPMTEVDTLALGTKCFVYVLGDNPTEVYLV